MPFASLPACAAQCGPLYDANGACVPPAAPAADEDTYDSCFCSYDTLQPFNQGASGVCDSACPADPNGLSGIQSWFTGFCNGRQAEATSDPGSSATSSSSAGSGSSNGGGGDWYVSTAALPASPVRVC